MAIAVFTTVDTEDQATALARSVLDAHLAACVQLNPIRSFYRWEGAVQDEGEVRLLFKTTEDRYEALAAHIIAAHPYDEPALWATRIEQGSESYLGWIASETSD